MPKKRPQNALIPIGSTPRGLTLSEPAVEASNALLAKNTIKAYTRDWMDFFRVDDLKSVTLDMAQAMTPKEVAAFRDELIDQGLGAGTISRKLSSVRAFYDHLMLRGLCKINPAHPKLVRAPKRGNVKKMEYLSPDEARKFLSMIDRSTVMGRRDYALIMTDLHMGLRRSELMMIRTDSFKLAAGKAYVTFRSKGEKERMVTVNKDLAEALADYSNDRGTEPGWLFPGRFPETALNAEHFRIIVKKYLTLAGITKKIGTHGLRATFITLNIEKGTPLSEIQKTVGHSRGETTLGYARDLEMIKSRAPTAMEGIK